MIAMRRTTISDRVVPLVASLALLFLAGCGGTALKIAFTDYGDVYAETQNHQMLLNLARLSQHHPTYFFQQGNIQAYYEFTGSVTASGGESDKSGIGVAGAQIPFINWILGSASGTATRSSKPQFNFVPLNGGEFAAQSIAPLPPGTFDAFFRDGFPVDVLMRSLVQQVSFTPAGANGEEIILRNTPGLENKTNYARFLRLCDVLRQLQDRGYLYLARRRVHQPGLVAGPEMETAPTMSDVTAAMDKDLHWQKENGTWHLEREATNSVSFQFEINAAGSVYLQTIAGNAPFKPEEIRNLRTIMGASVEPGGEPSAPVQPASQSTAEPPSAQLRSFMFVLADMAQEESIFDTLRKDPDFAGQVPASQLRPVLRMDWRGETRSLETPLVTVNYQGKVYQITDPSRNDGIYSSFNRDAFRLVSMLLTQISVDPAKLNFQQQILQVR
jgi:hypothetical protein